MTPKKPFKHLPGPSIKRDDRVRIQLARDMVEAYNCKERTAVKFACVLVPKGLDPPSLVVALGKMPQTFPPNPKEHLSKEDQKNLTIEVDRLRNLYDSKAPIYVDTSGIEGSPKYDAEAAALNAQMTGTFAAAAEEVDDKDDS